METILNLKAETIEALQELVSINTDSAKGYLAAADEIADPELKVFFTEASKVRDSFAHQLKAYVEVNDELPADEGSWKGRMHRWWLKLRGELNGGDAYVVLSEAERGEDAIKTTYERILKDTAGSAVHEILQQQYSLVKSDHDRVRDMRDARKQA